ncbi:MAG: CaiB/BaiF CoA transferase family protein [Acidimicrobiales bacterium]
MGMLSGVRVLDLSAVGPATRCTRVLADYGADVVKVLAPRATGHQLAFHAYSGHRGMRRATIDLRSPAGHAAFLRLAETADVVVESFRPGVAGRLGVDFAAVRAVNPPVVYCSTSGYGQEGPYAARAGHDLNYLAIGGFLHTSGRDVDGAPTLPGATVADIAAGGLHAAAAILAALFDRERSGEGRYLDVAVTDGVAWMLALYVDEYLATGELPGPGHNILTGRYACYGIYPTRDRQWLAVAAIEPAFWANLCRAIGLDHWIERQMDDDAQDAIRADLRAVFVTQERDQWVTELADADTCVAPVNDVAEVVDDPQFAARGAVIEAKHPARGSFRQLGPVLAGSTLPAPGSHGVVELSDPAATATDLLLAEVGYSSQEIAALRADGVVA